MDKAMIVAVVFGSITLWVAIIPVAVLMIIRMLKGGGAKKSQASAEQETRMIQELYQGLSKMEARVETLETLLMEKQRKDGHG